MMMSSSQNKGIHDTYSTSPTKEGKTTVVVAVMRGWPKDGYHHHRSNKRNEQNYAVTC